VSLDGERIETIGAVEYERFQAIASEFEIDAAGKVVARKTPHGGADDATK
jgi:hypothetical protein